MPLVEGGVARERNKTPVTGTERCKSVSVEHLHIRLLQVTLQGECVGLWGDS